VHETLRREERLPEMFIQPLSVTYVGPKRRLAVWALEDETPFFQHLMRVACLRRIDVALTWGEPIPVDIKSDRKVLTKRLEETVRRSVADAHRSGSVRR
jgi:1-acyl-sn-glycerol-3-phosphate acyltransferase